jgi:hypothetical protein
MGDLRNMAWRLCNSIERIEIDNREPGKVFGSLWLYGRTDPIRLDFIGNALRDIAGTKITFTNPHPDEGEHIDLGHYQIGVTGDITASRKVRVYDVSVEEAYRMKMRGEVPPEHMENGVYIEWYSEANGRIVIESTDFAISVSEPHWIMTMEEELHQQQRNLDAVDHWTDMLDKGHAWEYPVDESELLGEDAPNGPLAPELHDAVNSLFSDDDSDEPGELFGDGSPMTEFEWERQLKESDKLTNKFSKLMDEYIDHPERDKIIAQKMGWTWLEDAMDDEADGPFDNELFDETEFEDLPELEPNPATEGLDWIRRDDGEITHPLTDFAFRTAMDVWHYCNNNGLIDEDTDPDLHAMLFQAQTLSAKLAGALNGLAYDTHVEGGFIVACLKRALNYFNESSSALAKVEQKKLIPTEILHEFRKNLHEIRQEILGLMARFRTFS